MPTGKTPSQSYTEQVHMVNHGDLNGYKRLFGGTLLGWIDILAAIVAIRHTESHITTVAIDDLHFIAPAYAGDLVVLCGKVTCTGRTSVEVCVRSYVEHIDGSRRLINQAHVVLVALDENEHPVEVPPLIPETEEEKQEQQAGMRRRELRKFRQKEQY